MTKRVILKLQKRQYYWLSWLYQSCQVITSQNFWNQKGSDFLFFFFWDKLDILKRPENVFKSQKDSMSEGSENQVQLDLVVCVSLAICYSKLVYWKEH